MAESDSKSDEENSRIILYEGYLSKKGQINRSWKKRYFILFSDKKLAYYTSKELTHLQPINELNLSTVKELSLLPFSNNPPKKHSKSRTKSFTDIFMKKDNNNNTTDSNNNTLSSNYDSSDNEEIEDNNNEVYVDAAINTRSICNKRHAFDIMTEKRSYWLHCDNVEQLNEWIIYLKYAIFGKLILHGYVNVKSKNKLKTKWKNRFIEVYQSKIIRIYKNKKKSKVKQQIDIDKNNVSTIKYGNNINENNNILMENIIEIYDCNNNLSYIFSAKTKHIRDEFMDSFYLTMNAYKINILSEGYLHFRSEDAKYWKKSYFALISGALIRFKNEILCLEFKNSIYSCDYYYNIAFHKYIIQSMPMIDVKIEKISLNKIDNSHEYKYSATNQLLQSLKIFTITTTVGKWYFGAEEATQFLFWCQSFHTYCKNGKQNNNIIVNVKNKLFCDKNFSKIPNIDYDEKEIEHSESKKAHSAENINRFIMDINEDLMAINDEYEYEDSNSNNNNNNNKLSGNILMAVNLDKRAQTTREFNNQTIKKHFIGSQSLSLKPFTQQELMGCNNKKDNMKNNNEMEYIYTSDDDETSDEYDKDCLETTVYDNSQHKLKKHSMADYIIDDEY